MPTPAARPGTIVVTGASSGIGEGFARRFAARGHDLVVVARRRERLEALAAELTAAHGVQVTVLDVDLADPAGPADVVERIDAAGLHVRGLVNAAGFGTAGPFAEEDPGRVAAEVQLNVAALTALSRLLLPRLIAQRGLLVQISSTASHQPLPGGAVYAATKAYVTSLTEAIWAETRGSGLRVLALCPGPTLTEFFQVAGSEVFKIGTVATVDQVLDVAFRELARTTPGPVRTVGRRNAFQGWVARVSPRRLRLTVAARLMARN